MGFGVGLGGGLGGGLRCLKFFMFLFNLLVWFAGSTVLAVGLWLRFDSKTKGLFEGEDSPSVFYTGVYILIAAGALMMVVGFLGCCGAIQESPCMLGLFFFSLLVIFAIEVAAGFWGFSNQSKVVDDITQFYRQTYNKYKETKPEALKKTLHLIQHGLNCCGPSGTSVDSEDTCPKKEGLDELITKGWGLKVHPESPWQLAKLLDMSTMSTPYSSCPDAIEEVFNSKLHIIGGVGIGIGVVMVFGMLFSMMLCCAIRKSREIV